MSAAEVYLTPDFVVTQEPAPGRAAGRVEIWVDWVPPVDGGMDHALRARREGNALLVFACQARDDGQAWPVRRLEGLSPDALRGLGKELVWVICGPSGVLSRRIVPLEMA